MKKWKRLLVSLLTVSMTLGASTMSVMADDTTPYTYKVTLSAGNKGTINGQSKIEVSDIAYRSKFSFDNAALYNIQVTDDRYYVKGIRLSGRDNASSKRLDAPAFTVEGDADYVVAYGIKGNMVAYTVNYQDASGNSLAESQTFYGNVGDKPVVAYRYVENYIYNFQRNGKQRPVCHRHCRRRSGSLPVNCRMHPDNLRYRQPCCL